MGVAFVKEIKNIKKRQKIVALDPGEKIFLTFYSLEKYGKIGENMREKILGILKRISKLQSIIEIDVNKNNLPIRNKRKQKKKVRMLYKKIEGFVNEIHKKAAQYLCENYETILLPEFKTQSMISNKKKEIEKNRINKIQNKKEKKQENRKLTNQINLSKKVKQVLTHQSHYKFKEYLKAKAKEYKTKLYIVSEKYTSQACTKCGELSKEYNKLRIKQCNCKYKIDRDVNGSRNILIKNMRKMVAIKGTN